MSSKSIVSILAAAVPILFSAVSLAAGPDSTFSPYDAGAVPTVSVPSFQISRPAVEPSAQPVSKPLGAVGAVPGLSGSDNSSTSSSTPKNAKPSVSVSGAAVAVSAESSIPPVGSILSGRAVLADAGYFLVDGISVRLAGLLVPPAGERCLTSSGTSWMCGKAVNVRLSMLLDERNVSCRVVRRFSAGVSAVCSSGSTFDVGRLVAAEGWGVPDGGESVGYDSEFASAASAKAGLWSGSFSNASSWK